MLRVPCALPLALALAIAAPAVLSAQFDPAKTPIVPAPLERYNGGELMPQAIYGDNSSFDIDNNCTFGQALYQDLDTAGGFLFTAADKRFEIYSINPPPLIANQPLSSIVARSTLMSWVNSDCGFNPSLRSIRAATSNLVAISIQGQGFSVWNTTVKAAPTVHYQDIGISITTSSGGQMHIVTAGSTHWAFVAANGLIRYNLSAASALNRCLDDSPSSTPCNGVYQGKVDNFSSIKLLAGAGNFVAVVPPGTSPAVSIYDMSNPLSPVVKLTGTIAVFPQRANDIALWQAGASLYLAAVYQESGATPSQVKIFDVSCAVTPGSCSLPSPLSTVNTPAAGPTGTSVEQRSQNKLSASTTGSRNFLYVANNRWTTCWNQAEQLLDVTTPSQAFDITPHVHPDGYWGWYYMNCLTGSNYIGPRRRYFEGPVFYRAANSGLDSHLLLGAMPPVASFTCTPQAPFVGESVTCTDTSTGVPDQWSWTFQDATPQSSTLQNPSVVFNAAGAKQVTLVSTNGAGASNTAVATINVVDPAPNVASVSADVTAAFNCSQVTFTAEGATGQTPLTFNWQVDAAGGGSVATGAGNPFAWSVPPALKPGGFTATVTVNNAVGPPAMATSPVVTISSLPALAFLSGPSTDPFTGSTVQFHVDAAGATEWNWDFGDGTTSGWVADPVAGPNPLHTYALTGMYTVTVQVRNCVEGPLTSAPISIDVVAEPLMISNFQAQCPLGFCLFDTSSVINFVTAFQGTPDSFEYDWDGDTLFEEIAATALTQHTYCTAGNFKPVLRIRRGLDLASLPDTNASPLTVGAGASCTAPAAPTLLIATPAGTSIDLSWSDNASNELGYRVLRSVDGGATLLPIATLPVNSNGYSDTSVAIDQIYTYQVQAFALTGVGNSNQASATLSLDIFADGFESGDTSAWTGTASGASASGGK